jgi:hypothetical protein
MKNMTNKIYQAIFNKTFNYWIAHIWHQYQKPIEYMGLKNLLKGPEERNE